MIPVEGQLVADPKSDQQRHRQAHRQAGDIEDGMLAAFGKAAQGGLEICLYHEERGVIGILRNQDMVTKKGRFFGADPGKPFQP